MARHDNAPDAQDAATARPCRAGRDILPAGCVAAAYVVHARAGQPPGHAAISFHAYAQVLEDGFYWWVVWQTVRIGLVVTCLTVPLSFPIALFLSRSTSPWRGTLAALAVAPLLTSTVIRTYGWMVILGRHGLINRTLLGLGVLSMPVRLDNGSFCNHRGARRDPDAICNHFHTWGDGAPYG
ncbi:hypothetical protein RI056_01795 [Komagataeibacter nataicola]|uniref:ABC transporter permease n=1 Tax=Komagataeibacter nataicola TaxID=265960 RepID=UPI0028A921DF|nr:hypothetical protein [Komagataeibacter nataicola]WNM08879.1 hypothetical protein RI056_01795 [Komagataeibacter nataicola]